MKRLRVSRGRRKQHSLNGCAMLLLHSFEGASQPQLDMHIFTELVGIQMLLMNTLEPLLRGDKLAQEQLTVLFRQVHTTKAAKAQEILASAARTRRNNHARRPEVGPERIDHLAAPPLSLHPRRDRPRARRYRILCLRPFSIWPFAARTLLPAVLSPHGIGRPHTPH